MASTPRRKGMGLFLEGTGNQIGEEHQERISQECQRRRGDGSRDPKLEEQPVQRS